MENEDLYSSSDLLFSRLTLLGFRGEQLGQGASISPDYFCQAGPAGEQFSTFVALTKWLFGVMGWGVASISAYSDPGSICGSIVAEMRGHGVDLGGGEALAGRLRPGWGGAVLKVLGALAEAALGGKGVGVARFAGGGETQVEGPGDEVEEDEEAARSLGAEELDFVLGEEEAAEASPRRGPLETEVDEREWAAECERAAQKLAIGRAGERSEWRFHLDINKSYCATVESCIGRIRSPLERISEVVERQLEKIAASEVFLNQALGGLLKPVASNAEKKKETDARIKVLSLKIKELAEEATAVNSRCEDLQAKLDEQNNKATNDEPVIKMKKTIDDLKKEILKIDIRLGVLAGNVLSKNFREKRNQIEGAMKGTEERLLGLEESNIEELV